MWLKKSRNWAKSSYYATDLTEKESPDNAVKYAVEKMGKIGTLVNNAGMGRFEMVLISKMIHIKNNFNSMYGYVWFVRSHTSFQKNGGGQIVNIGSIVGYMGISKGSFTQVPGLKRTNESWREELILIISKFVTSDLDLYLLNSTEEKKAELQRNRNGQWCPETWSRCLLCTQGPNSDIKEISIQVLDRS